MKYKLAMMVATSLLLQACSDSPEPTAVGNTIPEVVKTNITYARNQDIVQITRGGKLFQQNCAECHGVNAEGAPVWHQPDAQGKYPPPPLNGSGHAWHHPRAALEYTIRRGTQMLGGNMPPWQDKLSDQDIDDIIAWFQAKWPEPLYQAWARNNANTRGNSP